MAEALYSSGTEFRLSGPASILAGLAILHVNFEKDRRTYLDSFFPFVQQAILDTNRQRQSSSDISAAIYDRFRLSLPPGVVRNIIARLKKRELIVAHPDGTLELATEVADTISIPKESKAFLRRHNQFLDGYVKLAVEHGVDLERIKAEEALLRFIDVHGFDLLRDENNAGPGLPLDRQTESASDYLLARYVKSLLDRDDMRANHVLDATKAVMVAASLYTGVDNVDKPFEDTTVYCDTKLLLRAMGYSGPEYEAAALPTLELCKAAGARLACFRHNLLEIKSILFAVSRSLLAHRTPDQIQEVERHVFATGMTAIEVEQAADSLVEKLTELGVAVDDTPEHETELTVDEDQLEKALHHKMPTLGDTALINDLNSLTAVHRLRHGRVMDRLEKAMAILATTSSGLCAVAREQFNVSDGLIPLAILEHQLQTAVWLKHPVEAPDLPRSMVIAHCYAAIQPSSRLWSNYIQKVDELADHSSRNEIDFLWLRYSPDARAAVMDRTLGVSNKLTPELLEELLVQRDTEVRKPLEAEIEMSRILVARLEDEKRRLQENLAMTEGRATEEARKVLLAEEKLRKRDRYQRRQGLTPNAAPIHPKVRNAASAHSTSATESNVQAQVGEPERTDVDRFEMGLDRVIHWISNTVAGVVVVPFVVASIAIVIICTLAIAPDGTPFKDRLPFEPSSATSVTVFVVAIVIGILGPVTGFNVWSSGKWLRNQIATIIQRKLKG